MIRSLTLAQRTASLTLGRRFALALC